MAAKLMLVVTAPFSRRMKDDEPSVAFSPGQQITDAADMKAIRASHPSFVVQTVADPPAPVEEKAAKAKEPPPPPPMDIATPRVEGPSISSTK